MSKQPIIGIIGLGSVGKAVQDGLSHYFKDVRSYDIESKGHYKDILDTDIYLICVSTDMRSDDRLDMSNVISVLERLDETGYKGLVCIKSTVQLGFFDSIKGRYNLRICYAPEFLRERSAFKYFVYPDRLVFGFPEYYPCTDRDRNLLDTIFHWAKCPVFYMTAIEAELMKLAHNAKIATDVTFTNEIAMICADLGCDAKKVMESIWTDRRRTRHWMNPEGGPYGGKCVPKDTNDIIIATKSKFFQAVKDTNELAKERHRKGEVTFSKYRVQENLDYHEYTKDD